MAFNEEDVLNNLLVTFSNGVSSEQRRISENFLLSSICNINLCKCLINIIIEKSHNIDLRKSSMLLLKYMVVNHWSTDLPDESKELIINNIFKMFQNAAGFIKIALNFSLIIINCTYFNGCFSGLINLIIDGFNNDENNCLASLILSYSICHYFKYHHEPEKCKIYYCFIPYFIEIISNNDSLSLNAICFKNMKYLINENPIEYLIEKFFIIVNKIVGLNNLVLYDNYFLKQIMKFISKYIHKYSDYLNIQQIIPIYHVFLLLFSKINEENLLSAFAGVFKVFMFYSPLWELIKSNMNEFVNSVLFKFFILDDEDIKESLENPSMFLGKFQIEDVFYDNSARSFIFASIKQRAKDSPELCWSIYLLFETILNQNIVKMIFPVVILFSSSIEYFKIFYPEESIKFISIFNEFCLSDNYLIRASGLFGLKYLYNYDLPANVYYNIGLLINDNSLIVQYYAATTFSILLRNEKEKKKLKFLVVKY